jgi:hypothetical protein
MMRLCVLATWPDRTTAVKTSGAAKAEQRQDSDVSSCDTKKNVCMGECISVCTSVCVAEEYATAHL